MENQQQVKEVRRVSFLPLALRRDLSEDDYATLGWGIRDKYPRLRVYLTKKPQLEDGALDYSKIIIAPFTYPVLLSFIENLEDLIKNDNNVVSKLTCYNNSFVNGKRTNEVVVQAELKIARSQDGVVNIGIKVPTGWLYFPLIPDVKWHKFYDKNGDEITDKRILSNMYARAYVNLLKKVYSVNMV